MIQLIRSVDEDAWTSVEEGWEEPHIISANGEKLPKPKDKWTDAEKIASKFNSKAMSVIFGAVDLEQFKLIQGSESAKEAWDILRNSFEGDASVRRTRLDHLATQFENLRMGSYESIKSFSSKLSAMAHEASVLGKKYKEKKLVKNLLRCLPTKFAAHKAVLKMTDKLMSLSLRNLLECSRPKR